jgi:bile acid:Na+ symporter, BASS family
MILRAFASLMLLLKVSAYSLTGRAAGNGIRRVFATNVNCVSFRPSVPLAHSPRWSTGAARPALLLRSSVMSDTSNDTPEEPPNALDVKLQQLTNAFPLFVVAGATLAVLRPSTLLWVNQGNLISILLASVMCGTGLTLTPQDFLQIFQTKSTSSTSWPQWLVVPLGVACQFIIMPAAAYIVGKLLLWPIGSTAVSSMSATTPTSGQSLFLGLCLVGCAPGGTASNLVSLIAQADVALSVILTAASTMLAVVMTPLLVSLLVGTSVAVSGWTLCRATASVVLAPVLCGMWLQAMWPRGARYASRFTPFLSVLLVSIICGGVVAQNAALWSGGTMPARVGLAVLLLHTLGFTVGYLVPRTLLAGKPRVERIARTISIEVGMQNSALAVVLARSIQAPALACLPGALSATVHSCLGSMLAAYWRLRPAKNNDDGETS